MITWTLGIIFFAVFTLALKIKCYFDKGGK